MRYRVSGYFSASRHRSFTGEFSTEKNGLEFMKALSDYIQKEAEIWAEPDGVDDYGDRTRVPEFHLNSISTIRRRVVEL